MFSSEKINAMLSEISGIFNQAVKVEDASSDSDDVTYVPQLLGNIGVESSNVKLVLCLPSQIKKEKQHIIESKWYPSSNSVLSKALGFLRRIMTLY